MKIILQWLSTFLLMLQVPWYLVFFVVLLPVTFTYFIFVPIEYFFGDNAIIRKISIAFDFRMKIIFAPTMLAEYILRKNS